MSVDKNQIKEGGVNVLEKLANLIVEAGGDKAKVQELLDRNYVKAGKPGVNDRLEWITQTESISELRSRAHTAASSKSKMQNNPIAKERYEAQIKAAQDKINGLIAQIEAQENPEDRIRKSVEFENLPGSTMNNYILPYLKEKYEDVLLGNREFKELAKKAQKQYILAAPAKVTNDLARYLNTIGEEYLELFTERVLSNNNRYVVIAKTAVLAELIESSK